MGTASDLPRAADDTSAHVYLAPTSVSRIVGKEQVDWWYDETHACVISLRPIHLPSSSGDTKLALFVHNVANAQADHGASMSGPHGLFSSNTCLINVKLSVDRRFLAVQRSDMEVELWPTTRATADTALQYSVMCKRSSRILGLFWNAKVLSHRRPSVLTSAQAPRAKPPSQYLALITTGGIELFKITSAKCKFHRLLAYAIHTFWFHPRARLLVLNTGVKGTELRPYFLDGGGLTKCSKVVVAARVEPAHVSLVQLYNSAYILYAAASSSSSMHAPQLLVYRVFPPAETVCVRAFHLGFHDPIVCSVVDHVLVVHSAAYSVACLYDIAIADTNDPFLHPLPLGGLPSSSSASPPLFVAPRFVVATDDEHAKSTASLHSLTLHLPAIAACANVGARPYLVLARFLLRRGDAAAAKRALFATLVARLRDGTMAPPEFRAFVHLTTHLYANTLFHVEDNDKDDEAGFVDVRAANHMLVLLQREWLHHVWHVLVNDAAWTVPTDLVAHFLLVYMDSLHHHCIVVDASILIVYMRTLAKLARWTELIALPMDDSLAVARVLDDYRHAHPAVRQLALDMYHRLGAVDDLVRMLLDDGNITMALRLAMRYATSQKEISHSAPWFFNAVVAAATKQAMDETKTIQVLYALHVFLVSFVPEALARADATKASTVAAECIFPRSLLPTPAHRTRIRRLFGFDDEGSNETNEH
ncbi:Aste57867_127 [Aphanomyces stellatus]|uniref:Aste57867_127 protein n=1 Tax=Aphanomyces stellatus TaxID=120398 RepID=A0A485K4E5_9STRA|nr:hypothetical protein As57867_000127 [Aphanomyces stellatus]VFT77353.1 Aste57867_127 [Aphanomyces stellatus]